MIVISDAEALNLERNRAWLRDILRTAGVSCSDGEDLNSLIGKVRNIQSWNNYFLKTLSGIVYDDELVNQSITFDTHNRITEIIFTKYQLSPQNFLVGCESLKKICLPSVYNVSTNTSAPWLRNCENVEEIIIPNNNNNAIIMGFGTTKFYPKLKLLDYGKTYAITTSRSKLENSSLLKHFIIRNDDTIPSLESTASLANTPYNTANGNGKLYVPASMISSYQNGTNWSALPGIVYIDIIGSRFEDTEYWKYLNATCTLDGEEIKVLDNETVAIFKHTENIEHIYENGVEITDGTALVKNRTLTSTV